MQNAKCNIVERTRSEHRRMASRLGVWTVVLLAGVVFGGADRLRAAEPSGRTPERQHRSLADLMHVSDAFTAKDAAALKLNIDEGKVRAAGIRKLIGQHLTLYTDLASDPEIDILPEVFDQAFVQWCEYFGKNPTQLAGWHITGVLMKDGTRFAEQGLLPAELPPFDYGFCTGDKLWLYEQPSAYYRRHLLLHEGTHGFMLTVLGSCGPPWYMEGLAELLGTHRWHEGRLTLNYMPTSREEVLRWGRIKLIEEDYAARRAKRLQTIIERERISTSETDMYAWCWAAATFLDHHPRYQQRFRQLQQSVGHPDLSARFERLFADDWPQLNEEWQVFVANLDYGYDAARMVLDFTPGRPMSSNAASVTVAADRGWQNSGIRLEAGTPYRLQASGRYQVADKPQIWWCEPGGVSIRYYRGLPLGILLAAVRPDQPQAAGPSPLIHPVVVGLGTTLTPMHSGTIFLRINDSAGELGDNAGELTVELKR